MLTDMDKILISGENEFLGLRLAERSIKEGFEVTVVNYFVYKTTRLYTGTPFNKVLNTLAKFLEIIVTEIRVA